MTKDYYFIRHGEIHAFLKNHYIGETDVELCPEGSHQLLRIGTWLKEKKMTSLPVFCSPLKRCVETANILKLDNISLHKNLKEISFGEWEGLTYKEIQKKDPCLFLKWGKLEHDFSFPGGESFHSFLNRVESFFNELRKIPEDRVIILSHGGVIRSLISLFMGLDFKTSFSFQVDRGSFSHIQTLGDFPVIKKLNWSLHE
jgi:broad specificity phosphatase PhoE